jgi:hypothetical protein
MKLCRGLFLKKGRMMKEDTRHKIEIAVDSEYSQEFADWLNEKGHVAYVGRTTENFINGVCIADDNHANVILMQLWEEFRKDGIYVS